MRAQEFIERIAKKVGCGDGWDDYTPDMPDEEILARLFKLNQERAGRG